MPKNSLALINSDAANRSVESLIHIVRGQKVMLDAELAELYGVTTGALNQAVRRNPNRFPADFMFQLTEKEAKILISQFVISSWGGWKNWNTVMSTQYPSSKYWPKISIAFYARLNS